MSEPLEIAKKLMDTIPTSMNWIRNEMRSTMKEELTIPQFRILASIYRGDNIACDIAKNHGTSQAAMSKMIDGLVAKDYVKRESNKNDRRHFHLLLTKNGDLFFKKTRKNAQGNLKEHISSLDEKEQSELDRGLVILEKLFLLAREKINENEN